MVFGKYIPCKERSLMVEPNGDINPFSKVRLCCSYLNTLGKPYSYEDGLELAKATLLYPQYLQIDRVSSSTILPKPSNNLFVLGNLHQISHATIEETVNV